MLKTSTAKKDIIESLLKSELGFVLLKSDGTSIYDSMLSESLFKEKLNMKTDNLSIDYLLFFLRYTSTISEDFSLSFSRSKAVLELFKRWDKAGYNLHKSSTPYGCKTFIQYLDSIEYLEADYIIFRLS